MQLKIKTAIISISHPRFHNCEILLVRGHNRCSRRQQITLSTSISHFPSSNYLQFLHISHIFPLNFWRCHTFQYLIFLHFDIHPKRFYLNQFRINISPKYQQTKSNKFNQKRIPDKNIHAKQQTQNPNENCSSRIQIRSDNTPHLFCNNHSSEIEKFDTCYTTNDQNDLFPVISDFIHNSNRIVKCPANRANCRECTRHVTCQNNYKLTYSTPKKAFKSYKSFSTYDIGSTNVFLR